MAWNYQPQRSVGPVAWGCLQLLVGIVGFVGFGSSISAKNVAFAAPATVLQVRMVTGGGAPAVVCRPINRPYQGHGWRGCCGSDGYSVALCSSQLREAAWRSMEMISWAHSLAVHPVAVCE